MPTATTSFGNISAIPAVFWNHEISFAPHATHIAADYSNHLAEYHTLHHCGCFRLRSQITGEFLCSPVYTSLLTDDAALTFDSIKLPFIFIA